MKVLTKQQFNQAVEQGKFDIRPNDTVLVNGNEYSLKVYEFEDRVEMEKIEQF